MKAKCFFPLLCAIGFLCGIGLNLNGSSVALWGRVLRDASQNNSLLLSTPKVSRTDEWEVWTPAVVSQSRQNPSFPVENPSLGAGKTPLLYSLPVRHYTMLFRPQLWGFFILDVERGYAWYWNAKIFGLLALMYLLCHRLTCRIGLSIFGSLWLFFSAYIQWWFSCPPMLPEMLSHWALGCMSGLALAGAGSRRAQTMAMFGLAYATSGFVLCMYPPYQIPLFYLGMLIVIAGIYDPAAATTPTPSSHRRKRWAFLLGAAALIAAGLIPFFVEHWTTLEIVGNTAYPGKRRSYGGALSIRELLTGFRDFFMPEAGGSNTAGIGVANFYPLWIPALCLWTWLVVHKQKVGRTAGAMLAALLVLITYIILPLPRWFCHTTLLSLTLEQRCLLPVGVAGILFSILTINALSTAACQPSRRFRLMLGVMLMTIPAAYLLAVRMEIPAYLNGTRTGWLIGLNACVLAGIVLMPFRLFAILFITVLAASNALINPVMRGLGPLTRAAPIAPLMELRQEHPDAAWVVYNSNERSQLVMSTGAYVLSGAKVVPDLPFFNDLDPAGLYGPVYNRYCFGYFVLPIDLKPETVYMRWIGPPSSLIVAHPRHPALQAKGVSFVAFTNPPPADVIERIGLQPACELPENRLWVYRLTPGDHPETP